MFAMKIFLLKYRFCTTAGAIAFRSAGWFDRRNVTTGTYVNHSRRVNK